ncbi:hypothetical protein PV326_006238 [Microctonus aethiopoides]|nr:hypothetical protein PV326_006238 [Microctonus aethiopoides]
MSPLDDIPSPASVQSSELMVIDMLKEQDIRTTNSVKRKKNNDSETINHRKLPSRTAPISNNNNNNNDNVNNNDVEFVLQTNTNGNLNNDVDNIV